MLFSSSIFLFFFLPIALGIYYLSPAKIRNLILVIVSLIFYTWGEKIFVLVMILTTVIDYVCALLIEKGHRKIGLILSITSNLLLLGFFKYFNFAFDNFYGLLKLLEVDNPIFHTIPYITLPIGISFYTFQTMSYTIDVYRGHVKANKNFVDFAAYVVMFPQLIAGPIVRYIDIHKQLKDKNINISNFALGVERFAIGLAKKMLFANTCAIVADAVFDAPIGELSSVWCWIGIVMYALQIYFDFSGYSDMAIGLGKMFGFDFLENFNYPYISKSIREFWQRWHISLSTWFRDYLYIPLGGSRVKSSRMYLNLFIVFFITGLWHGASWNFIVWGLFHGVFIVTERIGFDTILKRMSEPFQHLYALFIVLIGWVFFRCDDLSDSLTYLSQMFSFASGDPARVSYLNFFFFNLQYIIIGITAVVFCTPAYGAVKKIFETKVEFREIFAMSKIIVILILLVISASYIAADTYNPFIYFRF